MLRRPLLRFFRNDAIMSSESSTTFLFILFSSGCRAFCRHLSEYHVPLLDHLRFKPQDMTGIVDLQAEPMHGRIVRYFQNEMLEAL